MIIKIVIFYQINKMPHSKVHTLALGQISLYVKIQNYQLLKGFTYDSVLNWNHAHHKSKAGLLKPNPLQIYNLHQINS